MRTPVTVGIVGCGRWGMLLADTFEDLMRAELRWLCDPVREPHLRVKRRYPTARFATEIDELLADEALDAVVIATPAATHYQLARRALAAEKHVFVEKPLALHEHQAAELIQLAKRLDRRLFVPHIALCHPAVRKLKELIELDRLGDIYYVYANRQELSEVRADEDLLWKLGDDVLALILHLLDDEPVDVLARGESYIQPGVEDVLFCHLNFATGISAHFHLSWLDALNVSRLTVVGSRRMAVFDELEPERKLTVHHKSAVLRHAESGGSVVHVTSADIQSLRLDRHEPVRLQCDQFLMSVRSPLDLAPARHAARVVSVLRALQNSLDRKETTKTQAVEGSSTLIPLASRSNPGGPPLDQSEAAPRYRAS
jgi:predicted dehydrogenase